MAALSEFEDFEAQFDKYLECSVCLLRYTNPKTLPCNHSFCLHCIQKLKVKEKDSQHYISCPKCRWDHVIPQNGVGDFPNAFDIIDLLDLREKLVTIKHVTCMRHSDSLRIYCDTCKNVVCRDCIASKEHDRHDYYPISDCYSTYHERLLYHLEQKIKLKAVDMNRAVEQLANREKEVQKRGKELKEEIKVHAQKLIVQIQKSQEQLLHQVDTIVQRKVNLLEAQKSQAEMLHTRLKTCEEVTEHILTKCSQIQVLTEQHSILKTIDAVSHHSVKSEVFEPLESADLAFRKRVNEAEIGCVVSSRGYAQATLRVSPSRLTQQHSTATLVLRSHDGLPLSVPPSLVSCRVSSPDGQSLECEVVQVNGEYTINFNRFMRQDQLTVQVGGIDVFSNPYSIDITEMRGIPVTTVTELCKPWGVAVCENGDIAVAENDAHCVTILSKDGKKVRSFGKEGTKEGEFMSPRGVAVTNDGHILVTDLYRLQKLTLDGTCVKSVGGGGGKGWAGQKQLRYPAGITFHSATRQIFVADSDNNRVRVFTNDLTLICTIVQFGSNNEQFNAPYDVAVDDEGRHLYVAEWGNHCITKLTTTGQYIKKFGCHGSAGGQLEYPTSVVVINQLVFVSEWGNNRISIFDTDGNFLHCFGSVGCGEGEFNRPYAVTKDTQGKFLYISDLMNNRVVLC